MDTTKVCVDTDIVIDYLHTPFDWTAEDSRKAAQIHAALSKSGETLTIKDVFIAGVCLSRTVPLVTRNVSHFNKVRGLEVIDGTKYLR